MITHVKTFLHFLQIQNISEKSIRQQIIIIQSRRAFWTTCTTSMLALLKDCSTDDLHNKINVSENIRYSARRIQVKKDVSILCKINICSVCSSIFMNWIWYWRIWSETLISTSFKKIKSLTLHDKKEHFREKLFWKLLSCFFFK